MEVAALIVFLIVLLIILAVIAIALISNLKIKLYLSKDGFLIFSFLFFKIRYDFYGENKVKRVKKTKKGKGKTSKTNKEGYFKKIFREKGVIEGSVEILSILKSIISKIFETISKATITKLNLNITVAGEDPALTAVTYGGVCAVVYPIIGLINGISTVKNQNVIIGADYETKDSKGEFLVEIKMKAYKSIHVVLSLIKEFL